MGDPNVRIFSCGDGNRGRSLPAVTSRMGIGIKPPPCGNIRPEDILIISHIKLNLLYF